MRVFADCREGRDLAGRRAFRAGWGCGAAYLTCLLTLVGLCRIASAEGTDNGEPPTVLKHVINMLSGKSDDPTVRVRDDSRPKAGKTGHSEGLVTEAEQPDDYKQIVADALYPPTASPQKLTTEQLDAIAKLAPQVNKAGMRVHPAMIPLFRSMILYYSGGTYKNAPIRFRLHTPEPYQEGKKYPLVVWLHGAGECGLDNVNQLSHLHHIIPYLVGAKKRDFFLLVPQCPRTHGNWEAPEICSTTIRGDDSVECHVVDDPVAQGNAPLAFTLAMIDAVKREFPVDPNRVTIAGLSTGGDGTWRILERRPDLFAAAAPIVSWNPFHEKALREKPSLKKIPIWAIYSSDDQAVDYARKEFERVRDSGCHVYKTEFGVCGHRAWTPAMLQADVFGWLISRAKDGDRFFAAEPSPTSPEAVGIFADVTEGDLARKPTRAASPDRAGPSLSPPLPATPLQKEIGNAPKPVTGPPAPSWGPLPPPMFSPPMAGPPAASLPGPAPYFQPVPRAVSIVDDFRLELIARYIAVGETKKALAVADKVKDRRRLVECLLGLATPTFQPPSYPAPPPASPFQRELLDYVDRELDRMEQRGYSSGATRPHPAVVEAPPAAKEEPLMPVPAGKKTPMDDCGKEWAMAPTNLYGLFPNGWEHEADHVPGYVINETGRQLRDRLAKAFTENDLAAMKEFCESFIRLDDIPLSSPWFDTSGGRLQGRIKYTLNEKAKPVVELLRDIAGVKADSKKEFVELARKSLKRIDAIIHAKTEE